MTQIFTRVFSHFAFYVCSFQFSTQEKLVVTCATNIHIKFKPLFSSTFLIPHISTLVQLLAFNLTHSIRTDITMDMNPLLPEENIIETVCDALMLSGKADFTINDLQKPTYEKMYTVYTKMCCMILNTTIEQTTQLPLDVAETIAIMDCNLEEASSTQILVKCLKFVFSCCLINFTSADLLFPTKRRTKKLLSALCNFIHFGDSVKFRDNIIENINSMRVGIKSEIELRTTQQTKIAYIKDKEIKQHNAVQEMNLSALKAAADKTKAVQAQLQAENDKMEENVEQLKNYLIVSKASRLVQQAKATVDGYIARSKSLGLKEKQFDLFREIAPALLKLLEMIVGDLTQLKKAEVICDGLVDMTTTQLAESKQVINDIQNCKRQIRSSCERKNRLLSQEEKKREHLDVQEAQLKAKNAFLMNEMETVKSRLSEIQIALKNMAEEDLTAANEHEQIMKTLKAEFTSIDKTLSAFHNSVSLQQKSLTQKMHRLVLM